MSDLSLRKVTGHPQAGDAYRVIYYGIEVGSISKRIGAHHRVFWIWGIDTVMPKPSFATSGEGYDREDCMKQFRAVWEVFVSDRERLEQFITMKRQHH